MHGGIRTNRKGQVLDVENGGQKILPGLHAAGEVACVSVHGANRLGANSLLDIVVFGRAVAAHISANNERGMPILSNGGGKVLEEAGTKSFRDLERFRNANGTRLTADLRIEMQRAMQTDVAAFRNEDSLERLRSIETAFNNGVCTKNKKSDLELQSRGRHWKQETS